MKFAIFYHFILGKTGNVIDGECLVFWYENIVIVCRKYEEIFWLQSKPQHIEKAKSDLDKYINYLNTNTDIKMRDFTRKFNIKKAEALIVLNAVKESKIIKNHILFKEIKE